MKYIRGWRIAILMLLLGVAILGVSSTSIQFISGATVSDQLAWGPERFRSVNLDMSLIREGDLRVLSEDWNANLLRLNLRIRQLDFIQDEDDPYHLKEGDLQELDRFLDFCEKYGLRVVISNHRPIGRREWFMPGGEDRRIWSDFKFHDYLIFFWRKLAERYAQRGDVIAGYDLMNEPNPEMQVEGTPSDWNLLASKITKAIRKVDKVHPIIIEPIEWGSAEGFKYLQPTGDVNTVYSFHFYLPMAFTHQGIQQRPLGISYPGRIEGEYWDKTRIRREMQAALDFQRRHNVPIYVGEFSVVRWAPLQGALQYLSDVIELLEEYNWDWSYWSFREWDGWSLEHIGPPDNPIFVDGESDRLQLVKRYFSLNQRWSGPLTGKGPLLPKVLFDEYHGERNTISYQRAKTLQAEHPEWYYYGDFMRQVEGDYVLRRSVQPLTYDLLRNYDVLILAAPTEALRQDEIQDILKFVKEGGGLLVLGDASLPLHINQLMTNFNMRFNNVTISSKNPDWDAQSFWITDFNPSHVVTQGIKRFHTNWACSMEKSEQVTALAYTGADTWRDHNSNGQQDTGEEVGPFVFSLALEYGNGRIIAIADNAFQQGMLNVGDNGQLMLNALAWLSASGGPYRH